MILEIKNYPAAILRKKTDEVVFPLADETQRLIRNMFDTVRAANGIGLAAPQVGKSQKVIVVNLEHLEIPIFALINPEVLEFSKKQTAMEEGCLSIPGVFGMVDRPEKIKFKAYDLKGRQVEAEANGLLSKVIQHEIDHINGILILDKIKKFTKGEELIK